MLVQQNSIIAAGAAVATVFALCNAVLYASADPEIDPTCACAFGKIKQLKPYCSCICDAGTDYAPPQCFYSESDMQFVRYTMDASKSTLFTTADGFSSGLLKTKLSKFYGLSTAIYESDIVFHNRVANTTKTPDNYVSVNLNIRSPHVPPLLKAFYVTTPTPTWMTDLGTVSIVPYIPLPDKGAPTGHVVVLYTFNNYPISSSSIAWTFGTLSVVLLLLITDCVLMKCFKSGADRDQNNAENAASYDKDSSPPQFNNFVDDTKNPLQ